MVPTSTLLEDLMLPPKTPRTPSTAMTRRPTVTLCLPHLLRLMGRTQQCISTARFIESVDMTTTPIALARQLISTDGALHIVPVLMVTIPHTLLTLLRCIRSALTVGQWLPPTHDLLTGSPR